VGIENEIDILLRLIRLEKDYQSDGDLRAIRGQLARETLEQKVGELEDRIKELEDRLKEYGILWG
jgi:lipase chaperone LimK